MVKAGHAERVVIWTEVLWGLLTVLLLLDARRVGSRLAALPALRPDEAEDRDDLVWVLAPGVQLPEATVRSALAHVEAHGLAALDLVPGNASLATVWSVGCHVDLEAHRSDSIRPGDTGMHAFVAPRSVVESLGFSGKPPDLASFVSMAREVRRRVDGPHEIAVAPGLTALRENPFFDSGALSVKLGGSVAPVAFGVPLVTALMVVGPLMAPWAGSLALLAHLIQQPIAVRRSRIRVRWSVLQGLLRIAVDLRQWLRLLGGKGTAIDQREALRPVYKALMAEGTDRFFLPKAQVCPHCGSDRLTTLFSLPDLYQGKPGRFSVDRCRDCRYRFQNPRLTTEGLDFYYRDFYDGLGEDALDMVFGATTQLYADRLAMVTKHSAPERWLDVGCGHGHLFAHIRDRLPGVRLEGLDMGDGAAIARARGWADQAHQGLFVDAATELSDCFDAVTMCHYLEHTLDLRAELKAAHTVLKTRGVVLIEVPDPDSPFAALLGRWWMPWFQPQHIQFATTINMASLLREAGFEPLEWHTGRANTANDFVLSFTNMVRQWAPSLEAPWRPRPSWLQRCFHALVWIPGGVFVLAGAVLDHALNPIARRMHHSSQYRVIARKL